MRRSGRLLAAALAAAVLLSVPAPAGAQGHEAADGERTGGAAASVDPLATQGRDRRAASAAATRSTRRSPRRACSAWSSRTAAASAAAASWSSATRDGKITTIDSRETAPAAMGPDSFFIENGKAADRRAFTTDRYSGLSAGVPGTRRDVGPGAAPLRHELAAQGAAAGASVARQRLRRRPDVLRPDDARTGLLRRRPVDGGDLPRPRRHAARRRHDAPQPGHGARRTSCIGRHGANGLLPRPDRRRDRRRRPSTRRSAPPPTTRGGPA